MDGGMVGTRGPAPKRSDQRRRRNSPAAESVKVAGSPVPQPEPDESWHELAVDWYRSLAESGQAEFYEPTDWQAARWCAYLMTDVLTADAAPAALVKEVRGLMTDLLCTEASRRRVQLELERGPVAAPDVPNLDDYRRRAG